MRIKKSKCFLLCILGLCVISFQHFYKVLHNVPLLQGFSSSSSHLKTVKMVSGFLWNVPDIDFHRDHIKILLHKKAFVKPSAVRSDSIFISNENLHQQTFVLQEDLTPFYVRTKSGSMCFQEGTDLSDYVSQQVTLQNPKDNITVKIKKNANRCTCRQGWHGTHCGVPTIVQHSNLPTKAKLTPRAIPRRVINAININHEFDLLHARFHELADIVDVFIICESNFTAFGDPRPLYFQQQLQNGTFDYIKHKILYILLDHFPNGGREDGWIADDYLRTYLTKNGMRRIQGIKADDVFLIDDADEIPAREGIIFLKLYDGWTEPVSIHMRKSLYGFYWKQFGTLNILSVCTVAMLSKVYKNDGILLRRRVYYTMPGFREYENSTGNILMPWAIGSPVHYAGWHCSWCFKPEGIYHKLVSAQNGDFPRWGDYGEKLKLGYIKSLIKTGGWFDGSLPDYPPTDPKEHMYAPKYFLDNFEKYRYLLENPYAKE